MSLAGCDHKSTRLGIFYVHLFDSFHLTFRLSFDHSCPPHSFIVRLRPVDGRVKHLICPSLFSVVSGQLETVQQL